MLFMPLSYKRSVHCSEKAEDASSTLVGGTNPIIASDNVDTMDAL